MSYEYDLYLREHRDNVRKAYEWLVENVEEVAEFERTWSYGLRYNICQNHDRSKDSAIEYGPYDRYFYGGNRSYQVVEDFEKAFLHHLHNNPHHWQHWILIAYDDEKGQRIFEMPKEYIIEMICDWWSFSWKTGNLEEIFDWYEDHKAHIQLGPETRKTVERILGKMKEKLAAQE